MASIWRVGLILQRNKHKCLEGELIDAGESPTMLEKLQEAVIKNGYVSEVPMQALRVCSLGRITNALFEVGRQYRRTM